jgi:hypothetical protein
MVVRSSQLAIAAVCAAAMVLIVLVALDTAPIADDYGDLSSILHAGVFQYLHSYWVGLTDRYSNAIFMVVLIKLFGGAAIHVATPLLIALLFCICLLAVRAIGGPERGPYEAAVVAAIATVTIAVSTPSIFDTLGWFNAVAIYFAGVVAAVGAAAWIVRLTVRSEPLTPRRMASSFFVGLLAAGFTEVIGIVISLGSLLAVANLRDVLPSGQKRRSLEPAVALVAIGAIVGVLVILLGPGSQSRARGGSAGHLPLIASALRMNLRWVNTELGWRTLLSVASGLALLHFTGAPETERAKKWLVTWAFFLCCVPILVVGAATGYSDIIPAPLRAASVATAALAIGEAAITYLLATAVLNERRELAAVVLPGAAVATTIGLVGFWTAATPVIQAEQLRRTAVDARALSIHRQLQEHEKSVAVRPAPLIDSDSGAYDLLFGPRPQLKFILGVIRDYYGIRGTVKIHVIPTQPLGYCLPHQTVASYGVESCAEIAAPRRAAGGNR